MAKSYCISFVYSFKRGDNLVYNGRVLTALWNLRENAGLPEKNLLNKPVVVIAASIIELSLCEIFHRARHHTREGVPNLSEKQIKGIRKTAKDDFSLYIRICKQNKIFGGPTEQIYKDLETVREARNRVHIQNLGNEEPENEVSLFTSSLVLKAEKTLEYVLGYLEKHYPRNHSYNDKLEIPWNHNLRIP